LTKEGQKHHGGWPEKGGEGEYCFVKRGRKKRKQKKTHEGEYVLLREEEIMGFFYSFVDFFL